MDLESAKKYVFIFAAIGLALPLAFVATGQLDDPTAKAAVDAIRKHTGGGGEAPPAAPEQPDLHLRMDSGYPLAAGWTADDPFTNQSRYWPEYSLLSHAKKIPGAHRVLLRSPVAIEMQIFLIVGPADTLLDELAPELEERKTHPLRSRWVPTRVKTADGTRLDLIAHGIGEGLIAGEAIEQLSGFSTQGDVALVVDAGGSAATFDRSLVLRVLRNLETRPLLAKQR